MILHAFADFLGTYFEPLLFNQAVAFAISQVILRDALPHGVELAAAPNRHGALLEPSIYRDSEFSCIYLVDDVESMLVQSSDVPQLTDSVGKQHHGNPSMVTPNKSSSGIVYKSERKSDYSTGVYLSSTKKVRKVPDYPNAKKKIKNMLGEEGKVDTFIHWQTMYILRCLDTSCSVSSLYAGLDHYESNLVNNILCDDFHYHGDQVLRNKANLLTICELFLNHFNATIL